MSSETIGQKILDFIREHLLDKVPDDDPLDDPDGPSNFPPANATEQLGTFVKREIFPALEHDLQMVKNNRDGMQKRIVSLEAELVQVQSYLDKCMLIITHHVKVLEANKKTLNLGKYAAQVLLSTEKILQCIKMKKPVVIEITEKEFSDKLEQFGYKNPRPTTPDA